MSPGFFFNYSLVLAWNNLAPERQFVCASERIRVPYMCVFMAHVCRFASPAYTACTFLFGQKTVWGRQRQIRCRKKKKHEAAQKREECRVRLVEKDERWCWRFCWKPLHYTGCQSALLFLHTLGHVPTLASFSLKGGHYRHYSSCSNTVET